MNTNHKFSFGRSQTTKFGAFTFAIALIVLVTLIIFNLLISAIPKSLTLFDTSTTGIYSVSDTTEEFLSSVSEKIKIYQIASGGIGDTMLSAFLERYTASSRNISTGIIDIAEEPNALNKYSITPSSLPDYSLIVESEKRFTTIDYSELFTFYNSYLAEAYGIGEVSYAVYQQYMYYFYAAETAGYTTEQKFCAENIINNAIEYVSLDTIPQIYFSTGHGESEFSDNFLKSVANAGLSYSSLAADGLSDIPENAVCIVIYAPSQDISNTEAIAVRKFINNGGNILLITSSENLEMQNLMSMIEPYGVSGIKGVVYDGTPESSTLIPSPNLSHTVTAYLSSYNMMMPNSHGIRISNSTSNSNVTSLFTTSEKAIIKNGDTISDPEAISLGVAIQNTNSNIIWYSCPAAFTDSVAEVSSYGNYYYALYSLAWLYEPYESSLTAVDSVSIAEPLLGSTTLTSVIIWAVIFILLIPLTIIVLGLIVWIKRRKR